MVENRCAVDFWWCYISTNKFTLLITIVKRRTANRIDIGMVPYRHPVVGSIAAVGSSIPKACLVSCFTALGALDDMVDLVTGFMC